MDLHPLLGSIPDFLKVLPAFLFRAGVAVTCGGLVGLERERRGKPAGFRTNTLICLGAMIYMHVGELVQVALGSPGIDPTRIASQVVTGVGFLGAGTIIQSRGAVTGLTSAATIWVVAAIGLMVGAGYPLLAAVCTAMTLVTLSVLARIEPSLLGRCRIVNGELVFSAESPRGIVEAHAVLTEHEIKRTDYAFDKQADGIVILRLRYCEEHAAHHRFLPDLLRVHGIIDVRLQGSQAGDAAGSSTASTTHG